MLHLNPEELIFRYRYPILAGLVGVILVGLGLFLTRSGLNLSSTKVEVLEATTESQNIEFFVEVAGAVEKPGVYKVSSDSRIEDALIVAGGLSSDADRVWVEKTLNRAAKISDGQKIYIPTHNQSNSSSANLGGGDQSESSVLADRGSGLVNINTATLKELDTLPGIGPVYGQSIIDHRPYSNIEELTSKGVLKGSVYEKIKDKITVY